jgi:single-strand DNA-binding protein
MQTMVFTGRLAADPQISDDFGKAIFRLIEKRGVDAGGKDRLVGVNCVSWSKGLNEKVIARALVQGCEAVATGAFIDTAYETRDGQARTAKELVVARLTVLDWAEAPDDAGDDGRPAAAGPADSGAPPPQARRRRARAA